MQLTTSGLLSITDGRMMGDMAEISAVANFMLDEEVPDTALPRLQKRMSDVVLAEFPTLQGDDRLGCSALLAKAQAEFGTVISVPDDWSGCLTCLQG